jgi:hypothetical protein
VFEVVPDDDSVVRVARKDLVERRHIIQEVTHAFGMRIF